MRLGLLVAFAFIVGFVSQAQADDLEPLDSDWHDQITPSSPVAGGNDPNDSTDTLYILEEDSEDFDEIIRDQRGIIRRNGQGGRRQTRRTHVFVNPSVRASAKKIITPKFALEAFVTSGVGAFRENVLPFETRVSNIAGGATATADLGFVNIVLGYEHRQAFSNSFDRPKTTGDKLGATINKTIPLFVPQFSMTPQIIVSREAVTPLNSSLASLEGTLGFTYKFSDRISVAASGGSTYLMLYGLPGQRRDNVLKLSIGTTVKATDNFLVTVGAITNKTAFYGLTAYRADGSLSPSVNLRYNFTSQLSASLFGSYGRFLSTTTGNRTFKYNLNPSVALTVPL